MVDALRRVTRWLNPPLGRIIDLRPADVTPYVELGLEDGTILPAGALVADEDRRHRHAAADTAVRLTAARGEFTIESPTQFPFYRHAESPAELREYIATKWQHTRLEADTFAGVVDLVRRNPDARLWLREEVAIRVLKPAL